MNDPGERRGQSGLARWVEAGLLVRTRRGNQVYYQANTASPVFAELKGLTVKTAGMADVLREALAGLADRDLRDGAVKDLSEEWLRQNHAHLLSK